MRFYFSALGHVKSFFVFFVLHIDLSLFCAKEGLSKSAHKGRRREALLGLQTGVFAAWERAKAR